MKKFKDIIQKPWFANAMAGCITVAFYIILSNINSVWGGITHVLGYFTTLIYGCVLAYLMNPLAKFYQRTLFRKMKSQNGKWTMSIVFSVLTVVLFVTFIMSILIPQLFDSVVTFITNLDSYAKTLQEVMHEIFSENGSADSTGIQGIVLSSENIITTIVGYISDNSSKIINISTNAGESVLNWLIAFILSVYLLASKIKLKSGAKRLISAAAGPTRDSAILNFLDHCNVILNRYVMFSLIDGLIVGMVNAIFMSICGMQYVGLVSVVVGITNLVPTFGPLIGAIIGGFILLMVKPVYALIFIIFTVVLQTIDGYIIKPKLFGNTLGVSGLLILISILVGGKIYGIIGILLGIPFAAIIDYIYREILIPMLEKRQKPAEEDETISASENNQDSGREI